MLNRKEIEYSQKAINYPFEFLDMKERNGTFYVIFSLPKLIKELKFLVKKD